jgi:hypothetical protein
VILSVLSVSPEPFISSISFILSVLSNAFISYILFILSVPSNAFISYILFILSRLATGPQAAVGLARCP